MGRPVVVVVIVDCYEFQPDQVVHFYFAPMPWWMDGGWWRGLVVGDNFKSFSVGFTSSDSE